MLKILILVLVLFALPIDAKTSHIKFGVHDFDPLSTQFANSNSLKTTNKTGLKFIQFNGSIKQKWLDELKSYGIEILQYYPDNTYLVWSNTQDFNTLSKLKSIRWLGDFKSEFKQSHDLTSRAGIINNVDVHFYNSGSVDTILADIKHAGARLLTYYPAQPNKKLFDAVVEINANNIKHLAEIPEVIWIGYIADKGYIEDESSAQIVAGNFDINNAPILN